MAKSKPTSASKRGKAPGVVRDRHELYQLSVQDPPSEVYFIHTAFERLRGRVPLSLREDFAGTSVFSLEWVRSHERRTAICVDLDMPTLEWGLTHRIRPAGPDIERRISLRCGNVLDVQPPKVEVGVGFNFSYWCFDTRASLRGYFEAARAGLVDDGILVLDAYGGTEVPMPDSTKRKVQDSSGRVNGGKPFTYVWEQIDYDPISAHMNCAIHFEFGDGSKLERAFSYSWRVWTLPEISELLLEAGFRRVLVWAELEDEAGDPTGVFEPAGTIDNCGVWWVYITAEV